MGEPDLRNGLFSPPAASSSSGGRLVKGKDRLRRARPVHQVPRRRCSSSSLRPISFIRKGYRRRGGQAAQDHFFRDVRKRKASMDRTKLREFHISIDEAGTNALLELVENDSAALDSACSASMASISRRDALGESEVEAAIARSKREDAFSLFERSPPKDSPMRSRCSTRAGR